MEITFEQLPAAVSKLYAKLENIERILSEKESSQQIETDQLFTIDEAAAFTHLSKPTIYSLVSKAEIPCMKKGKRLYFTQKELIEWIKSGRKKTVAETAAQAEAFVNRKVK